MKYILALVCFLLLYFVFVPEIFGQETDTLKHPLKIFVYNEKDEIMTLDVGGGIGIHNGGLKAGFMTNIDVYHIMLGYSYSYNNYGLISSKEARTENSFVLGYRYRNRYVMVALAAGIGSMKFKCTSGSNYDCYNYVEETISSFPISFQADCIITDNFAMGMNLNHIITERENISGFMITLKFGAFKNIF